MKKLVFLTAVVFFANYVIAQSEKYVTAMKKNIGMLDSVMVRHNPAELANNFERIGEAEKTQWLPYYYAAYCNILSTYIETDKSKIDGEADKADLLINKAEQLLGMENSETDVIKSMIASAHMMVDPQNRYMTYGQASSENIAKAEKLDPTNPRPIYLEGTAKFYTPEAFGGGKPQAEELFKKALSMFDSFKPQADLYPTWGRSTTEYFISMCHK